MAPALTFFLNGDNIELMAHEIHPRMTLLDYLREKTPLTGATPAPCPAPPLPRSPAPLLPPPAGPSPAQPLCL